MLFGFATDLEKDTAYIDYTFRTLVILWRAI